MWQNPVGDPSSFVVEELGSDELDLETLVSLIVVECGCETFSVVSVPESDTCVCPPCSVLIGEYGAGVNVSPVCHLLIFLIVVCAVVVSEILPWTDDDPCGWIPVVCAEKTSLCEWICEVDADHHFPCVLRLSFPFL